MFENYEKYLGESKSLSHEVIQTQFSYLQGKVLTVVEAALEGPKLEAVKGLIKKMFNEQTTYVTGLCFPDVRMMTTDEAEATIEDYDNVVATAEEIPDQDA